MVEKPPPSPPVPDTYKIVVGIDYEKPSELALSTVRRYLEIKAKHAL